MVFQPSPWESAAYFWEARTHDLAPKLPGDLWVIPKTESADRQNRLEMTAYMGFGRRQQCLGPLLG